MEREIGGKQMIETIGLIIVLIVLGAMGLKTLFSTKDKITKGEQIFSTISIVILTIGFGMIFFASDSTGWVGALETGFSVIMLLLVGAMWFVEGEKKQLFKRYFESNKKEK